MNHSPILPRKNYETDIMENPVQSYYSMVDEGLFEDFRFIFSENIFYNRCGVKIYGLRDFIAFYYNKRKIKGKHEIIEEIKDGSSIVVKGIFKGKGRDNNDIEINFVDLFKLNEDYSLIEKRETYILSCYSLTV